jgi:hypothetical protein
MERILYSEIGALQTKYLELFGVTVRPDQLDSQVFNDIAATLNLVNTLIPSIVRGSYVCITSVRNLNTIVQLMSMSMLSSFVVMVHVILLFSYARIYRVWICITRDHRSMH